MFRQTVLVYHCGELTVAREFDGTSRILADSSEHVSSAFKFPNTPFVFLFFQLQYGPNRSSYFLLWHPSIASLASVKTDSARSMRKFLQSTVVNGARRELEKLEREAAEAPNDP